VTYRYRPAPRRRLATARRAHEPGSTRPHTVVVLPSYSVATSLFDRYRARQVALEHRQLLHVLSLASVPGARMVFVTSRRPDAFVVPYYLSLVADDQCADVAERLELVEVDTGAARPLSRGLLDRPDLLAAIRRTTTGAPALIEPWNVTRAEWSVSRELGIPLDGSAPRLWRLGFKSRGRRLLRRAGLPVPLGVEDVTSVDGVLGAVSWIRAHRPRATGVVVKTDDSGAGDGNRVLHLAGDHVGSLRASVEAWGPAFLADLARGGVVEELLEGDEVANPSVQLDIAPGGRVTVLSTHEQLFDGGAQVFTGCRFPADAAHARQLALHGHAVGRLLAGRGAVGKVSVDFMATRHTGAEWQLRALEINLRKSGTSHPFSLLQNLVGGHYDAPAGRWRGWDGSPRSYRSTDNLGTPQLAGHPVALLVGALVEAGLHFDRATGTGIVLHSLCALETDGGVGLTAVGSCPAAADELYAAARATLLAAAGSPATQSR
jgi:hypothetical protein